MKLKKFGVIFFIYHLFIFTSCVSGKIIEINKLNSNEYEEIKIFINLDPSESYYSSYYGYQYIVSGSGSSATLNTIYNSRYIQKKLKSLGYFVVNNEDEATFILSGYCKRSLFYTDCDIECIDRNENIIFSTHGNSITSGGVFNNPQDDYDGAFYRAVDKIPSIDQLLK